MNEMDEPSWSLTEFRVIITSRRNRWHFSDPISSSLNWAYAGITRNEWLMWASGISFSLQPLSSFPTSPPFPSSSWQTHGDEVSDHANVGQSISKAHQPQHHGGNPLASAPREHRDGVEPESRHPC